MSNVFRNGCVYVMSNRCETCIFHSGNRMHLSEGRVEQMVAEAVTNDSTIICHSTLDGDNAVCRGFSDQHKTQPLQIAERLGLIEFVTPPKFNSKGKKNGRATVKRPAAKSKRIRRSRTKSVRKDAPNALEGD